MSLAKAWHNFERHEREVIAVAARRFLVIIEQDEDGKYVASVPSLPGCHTQADNLTELEARVQEAIRLYFDENSGFIPVSEKFIGVHQVEVQP